MVRTVLVLAVLTATAAWPAVIVGQVDTFETVTPEGWFAGGGPGGGVPASPPTAVANGGPGGAGDAYLQITAIGGNGPGSRLSAINGSQWAGDYSDIAGISMDLRNFGTNDLAIRLVIENPFLSTPAIAISNDVALLPAGSGWTKATFDIDPSLFTSLSGSVPAALSTALFIRIVHAPVLGDLPSPVVGVLGVDNITAVPEPEMFVPMGVVLGAVWWMRRRVAL